MGYQRYVLVGGSMEPTIHRGSIVFDDLVRVRELRAGDVITPFLLLALPALLIAFTMLGKLWREGGQLVAERGTS